MIQNNRGEVTTGAVGEASRTCNITVLHTLSFDPWLWSCKPCSIILATFCIFQEQQKTGLHGLKLELSGVYLRDRIQKEEKEGYLGWSFYTQKQYAEIKITEINLKTE